MSSDTEAKYVGLKEPNEQPPLVNTEEQDYTNLTQLAASLCQTPMAAISFVDGGQLWPNTQIGMTIEHRSLEYHLSKKMMESGESLTIPDLDRQPLLASQHRATAALPVKFYTGLVIRTPQNQVLGTLSVLDLAPRKLTTAQIQGLETVARQVLQMHDIQQKAKELEDRNTILQDNNHLLWGTVSRNTKDLDQLNSELETLLYRASHDMARPLSSLEGLSNLAKTEPLLPDHQLLWEGVRRTTAEMRNLTDKFQQIFEVLSGQPRLIFPVTRFEELLTNAMERVKRRFPEANFSWEVAGAGNSPLYVSPPHLIIILTNLVENAWIYRKTNQPGPARLRIEILPVDHAVSFTFHDEGSGILPEAIDRVFEMFFRGSDASKGNGLGLYVVARAASALSGVYSVTSKVNKGTTFTFSLAI